MKYALLSLRIGLAFVFIYAAIAGFISPKDWIWYIPEWIQEILPGELLLLVHGIFELVLGLWLLSGRKIFYAAVIASLNLLIITLLNFGIFGIVFRDVGLFFASVALALLSKKDK